MADVVMSKGGQKFNFPSDRVDAAKAAGFSLVGPSALSSALTGAQTTVSLGKDDDIAATQQVLQNAVQKDVDAGDFGAAARRIVGHVAPLIAPFVPAAQLVGFVEQHLAQGKDTEGLGDQARKERQQEVSIAQEANPGAFTAGQVAGAALTAGASTAPNTAAIAGGAASGAPVSAIARTVETLAPSALKRAAAALPIGALTGAELADSGSTADRVLGGVVGGVTAGAGGAVLPAAAGAVGRALEGGPLSGVVSGLKGFTDSVESLSPRAKGALKLVFGERFNNAVDLAKTFSAVEKGETPKGVSPEAIKFLNNALRDAEETSSTAAPRTASPAASPVSSASPQPTAVPGEPGMLTVTLPEEAPRAPARPAEPSIMSDAEIEDQALSFEGGTAGAQKGAVSTESGSGQPSQSLELLNAKFKAVSDAIREGTPLPDINKTNFGRETLPRRGVTPTPVAKPPAAAARRRLSDEEATALIRDAAIEHGTTDAATLASKTGLSSGRVSDALKMLVKRFDFRDAVKQSANARGVMPPEAPRIVPSSMAEQPSEAELAVSLQRLGQEKPAATPPSQVLPPPDLLEGVAAQNTGGKVTPTTSRQVAAVLREEAQLVTLGDFANQLRDLTGGQRSAFLQRLRLEKGVDFANKVAKMAGMSTRGF